MPLELPGFGQDTSVVSGFTEPGHETYARFFLPLAHTGTHHRVPWRVAAEQVGLSLNASMTWDDLVRAAGPSSTWELPRATIDAVTAASLVEVLARQSVHGAATQTRFALWEGYAGEIDASLQEATTPIPVTGHTFLCQGSYRLLTARLDWALTRTDQQHCHVPAAIWTTGRSFVLASALYHDSFYLSCSRATLTTAQDAGLDVLEIDPDMSLPSRGD